MEKRKNIFKPDWEAIVQGVYSNIAYWLIGLVALGLWWIISNFDLLGFKKMTTSFWAVSLYGLTALGAGFVLYWVGRLLQNVLTFVKKNRKSVSEKSPKTELETKVDISVFDYHWTQHQLNIGAGDFTNFLKVGLCISNNSNSKIRCALRMMDVKYNGKGIVWNWQDGEEWVDAPVPVERKLIRWDEGYNPIDGKVDISPNGGLGNLLFAESNPYSMEFWFWYVDGKSKNHQNLEGKYKVFAQLEGDCERNGIMSGFQPIPYEIEFTYKKRKLENVRVSKIAT